MKSISSLIILFLPLILLAQKNRTDFKGEIVFNHYTQIVDKSAFDESLNNLIHKIDSLLIIRDGINEFYPLNTPTIKLQFDPRVRNDLIPIQFKYTYTNKTITSKYYRNNKESRNFRIINKTTQTVNTYSSKDSTLVKENVKYNFKNQTNYSLEEFRNDIKIIHGYKCYKILIKELDNRSFDNIDFQNIYPNSLIYTEMYVAENINSLYHSVSFDKNFLKEYFPIEIKVYSDIFKGKITSVSTTSISE